MRYILVDEERRNNCIKEIQGLDINDPFEVVIKPHVKKRSLAQNNLYYMWLPYIAEWMGQSKEETHRDLKVEYLGVIESKTKSGQLLIEPISTTTLHVKEMAEYLTCVEVLANENGILLPVPDDYNFALMRD